MRLPLLALVVLLPTAAAQLEQLPTGATTTEIVLPSGIPAPGPEGNAFFELRLSYLYRAEVAALANQTTIVDVTIETPRFLSIAPPSAQVSLPVSVGGGATRAELSLNNAMRCLEPGNGRVLFRAVAHPNGPYAGSEGVLTQDVACFRPALAENPRLRPHEPISVAPQNASPVSSSATVGLEIPVALGLGLAAVVLVARRLRK